MCNLSAVIENKAAIIVDVFEGVFLQTLRTPEEMFLYLEQSLGVFGFMEARMAAERSLRNTLDRSEREAVSLDEVYGEMHPSYQRIMQDEINLVLLSAGMNPEMKEVFDAAAMNKIPVYLYGNTNIPQVRVVEWLSNSNCGDFKRYYSAFSTGAEEEMYRDIISEISASPEEIIHIGHDINEDKAKEFAIKTLPYESVFRRYGLDRNSSFFAVLNQYKSKDITISILENSIANYLPSDHDRDYWECFGYKYIGIIAFEFSKYIGENAKDFQIKRVFFHSQSGSCFKAALDLMYPEIETELIHCPNRVLEFSRINNEDELIETLMGKAKTGMTFKEWIEWLDPSDKCCLHQKFTRIFPRQDQTITASRDIERIEEFLTENQTQLLSLAKEERENLNRYLKKIGVYSESSAVVDVSREKALLNGINNLLRSAGLKDNITGFWWEYGKTICWKNGLVRQFSRKPEQGIKPFGYLYRILELALSGPYGGATGYSNEENALIAPLGIEADMEKYHKDAVEKIYSGAMECIQVFCNFDRSLRIQACQEGAMAVCEYLQEKIDYRDAVQLQQMYSVDNSSGKPRKTPIFRQEQPVIGIVNPWPEDVSAEAEVITRLKRTAEENKIGCVLLDNFGHILDDRQKPTKQYVDENTLSFVITTHYECPKIRNVFYYNPLWNPPEIPLRLEDYTPRATNLFLMNDDYLIYDNGGMSDHLRGVLMNCPRTLEGASALTASFPSSAALQPKLDDPIMFYCGMNWEVMFAGPGRHEGLFKLLDETKKVKFYGPERVEAWGGLKPWEGYQCYKGMIPFDGFSILEKINDCGICLVLSSDIHRRAGAATNRLYEACAAGAVIISDDNDFVLQHFKDAALFITYNKNDPIDTFKQIMEKYDWIVDHPDEALELARRAQEIFLRDYSLDMQLKQIIANHPARLRQVSIDLYARSEDKKVLVTYVLNTQKFGEATAWLDSVFNNLHGQVYQNMELAIAADVALSAEIEDYCSSRCACARVVAMRLFDSKGIRTMTDGEAIRTMQKMIHHDYFVNTTADEVWFSDHISSLIRAIEDGSAAAYSGSCYEDVDGYRRVNFFDILNISYLFYTDDCKMDHPFTPGQFLFKAEVDAYLPDYLFGTLDGKEHIAYAGLLNYRYKEPLAFTRRMSLSYSNKSNDNRGGVLNTVMQYHFIRDLLRFYLPEQSALTTRIVPAGDSGISKRTFTDFLLFVPLKTYFLLRYYRFQMRRKKPNSAKYKKYSDKYDACLEKYRQYWNV